MPTTVGVRTGEEDRPKLEKDKKQTDAEVAKAVEQVKKDREKLRAKAEAAAPENKAVTSSKKK